MHFANLMPCAPFDDVCVYFQLAAVVIDPLSVTDEVGFLFGLEIDDFYGVIFSSDEVYMSFEDI